MKKSKVAVGIIVILGIAYVGTSWYTGNVIESNIEPKVAQLTQEINDYQDEVNVAINYTDYQKGIFSTKVHFTVTLTPKKGSELNKKTKTVTIFNDDITIHHGPFPLSALANGKFAPQMAWAEYQMTEQFSPELWKLAGNKSFITAYLGMSYQEYLTLKIANKAINNAESDRCPKPSVQGIEGNDAIGNCKLDMSAGDVSFESDKNFTNLLVSANLDKFAYSENEDASIAFNKFTLSAQPNSDKTGVSYQFNFGDFTIEKQDYYSTLRMTMNNMSSQGNAIYPNENIDNQIKIEKITFLSDVSKKSNNEPIVINQLTLNQTNKVNQNNTSNGLLNASVSSLWAGQQNLGYGSFDLDYQGISEQLLSNKVKLFTSTDKTENDNEQLNMKMSLNKFNWHNDAGDININATMNLSGEREELRDFDIDNIDMLKFNVDAPFNVLARLNAQVENPSSNTVTNEQIAKANQSLQMISRMFLRNTTAITFEKDNVEGIYSNVDYAKDRDDVKVNGKTMSKEEFFDNF